MNWRISIVAPGVALLFLLGSPVGAVQDESIVAVSLVNLLATPKELSGRTVSVFGYLVTEVEPRLYLTRDHAKGKDWDSAIPVVAPNDFESFRSCGDRYVTLIARFEKPGEHDGYSLYGIRSIRYREGDKARSIRCLEQEQAK